MNGVTALVVAFHPVAEQFVSLVERLAGQVGGIIVIDNTPGAENPELECLFAHHVLPVSEGSQLVRLGENRGIACAINIGIERALEAGCDFVLLSDQDSLPASDMVSSLMRAYADLSAQGIPVGAVGPTYTDLHTRLTYPFQVDRPGRCFYGHKAPSADTPHVEALTLITSGTLIPADVIQVVGGMREDFFIDQVDIEWSHRARSKGYRLFGTGWATMYHRMGDDRLRVWNFGWRAESAYSPMRIYYRLRNFSALWKLGYVDLRWKIRSSWYLLGVIYGHCVFGRQRLKSLTMAVKGIADGLRGCMGGYPGSRV